MGQFDYCTTNSLHGIIRSFSDQNKIWDSITVDVSSSDDGLEGNDGKNPFIYNSTNYWIGNSTSQIPTFIRFCFNNYFVKPHGFELGTTGNRCLPHLFSFQSFDEKGNILKTKEYDYSFEANGIHFFLFQSQPSKCFQLNCKDSLYNSYVDRRFDVQYLEIYGEIHTRLSLFVSCSKSLSNQQRHFGIFLILILF